MKQQRQATMLEIISKEEIETQEDLLEALKERGHHATQATISRDIKELSLVKKLEQGKYRYTVSASVVSGKNSLSHIIREGVLSVVAAQNIVVVKTLPGLAMAACTALDDMEIKGNVGTLAGDDTCILIMTDNETAQQFTKEMEDFLE